MSTAKPPPGKDADNKEEKQNNLARLWLVPKFTGRMARTLNDKYDDDDLPFLTPSSLLSSSSLRLPLSSSLLWVTGMTLNPDNTLLIQPPSALSINLKKQDKDMACYCVTTIALLLFAARCPLPQSNTKQGNLMNKCSTVLRFLGGLWNCVK